MRRSVLITASTFALLLAACQREEPLSESSFSRAEEPAQRVETGPRPPSAAPAREPGNYAVAPPMALEAPAAPADRRAPQRSGPRQPPPAGIPAVQVPELAYSYRYLIDAPAAAVGGLAQRHENACIAAGPSVCQVVGASTGALGTEVSSATLNLRATPQWLIAFRHGLERDAQAADGHIVMNSTETEDLTRQLSDTEAYLSAKRALRDRIQVMLDTRAADLQTALQVEHELARVQGEIDAAESQLQIMRARVQMSHISLEYRARGMAAQAQDGPLSPVRSALQAALSVFVIAIAAIIWFAAFALPFAIVIGPIVWFILRRRRKAKAQQPSPPADDQS